MQNTRISIITIGNELINGQRIDTNSVWLCRRLSEIGFDVAEKFAVGDDIKDINECLDFAAAKSGVILITGGLGPTDDDITREAVAEFCGVELQFNQELFNAMSEYFKLRCINMADKNRCQSFLPATATALANSCGTAPGFMIAKHDVKIFAMPGVPSEMKAMFESGVVPQLQSLINGKIVVCRKLKCICIRESSRAEKIGDIMQRGQNPLVNCTVSNSVITLYIVAQAKTEQAAFEIADDTVGRLNKLLGEYVFASGEQELVDVIARRLLEKSHKLATAESCTGGLIAKMLTDVAGSSGFFEYGWVTYSNEAKISQLGVSRQLLNEQGAVCADVVRQMATGALKQARSDYAIAISGIAGPTGGSDEKPVGLVYIAVCDKNRCVVEEKMYPAGRDIFRIRTTTAALDCLRRNFL